MIFSEFGDSLLMVQFREFYREVITLKRLLRESAPVLVGSDTAYDPDEPIATVIWQKLVGLFEQQQRAALHLGGEYWAAYEEARYVMVALADEIFLHSDWEGSSGWNFNLLESKIFQSHIAGELFFQNIDRLIMRRDPIRVELAKLYLLALSLGFQGRYRGTGSMSTLLQYRQRLYAYIFQEDTATFAEGAPMFPESHGHTVGGGDVERFPPYRRWVVMLAMVSIFMLGISYALWRYLTTDLRDVTRQILEEG